MEQIGEKLAVMDHRIVRLESWPSRVEALEHQFEAIRVESIAMREAIEASRKEVHLTNLVATETRDRVNRLFWTGAGVLLACSVIWGGVAVIWKYLSIFSA